jgi:3-hydroxyisobutyrate dehydrogenase-like beta-hydroxyacid dehydrogenase
MSPIAPRHSASPMLIGGPHARAFAPLARELGFTGAEVYSDEIGRASAAKMCRSVMIKGLEALLTESLVAARHYGVEDTVLASLANLLPAAHWDELAHYMIGRSLQHGRRRAEEMREVARTVDEAGVEPWMSRACAERQDWAAARASGLTESDLKRMLDAILATREPNHAGARR